MSRRLAALSFLLRRIGRPVLRRTKTPEKARRDFNLTARLFFRGPRQPAETRTLGGVRCLGVDPPEAMGVLLYFHGGGYVTGLPETHLPMVAHLAFDAGVSAILPDYRLAPEHPFPAAFDDALAVWQALRAEGVAASEIVLGGDSAGGGLALALLGQLLNEGERPAGLFAFSPWTDLTLSGRSYVENADLDAILPAERVEEIRAMVSPDHAYTDPRLSPLFAQFRGASPVYLQASRAEILRDDSLRLAERMREEEVDIRVDLWDDTPHVWQLFRGWLPEADDALDRTARFLSNCFRSQHRKSGN